MEESAEAKVSAMRSWQSVRALCLHMHVHSSYAHMGTTHPHHTSAVNQTRITRFPSRGNIPFTLDNPIPSLSHGAKNYPSTNLWSPRHQVSVSKFASIPF